MRRIYYTHGMKAYDFKKSGGPVPVALIGLADLRKLLAVARAVEAAVAAVAAGAYWHDPKANKTFDNLGIALGRLNAKPRKA